MQSGTTVKVATDDLTVRNIRSNATTGILQITGPAAASTRVATVPNANWTAARTDAAQSFTGDQTLSTGNLVQGTAAKGFNFTANTPLAGMTSQLLNWYEEGSYTPIATASSGSITTYSSTGKYTRIGRQVTVDIQVTLTNAGTASGALIATLPFACGQFPAIGCGREDQNTGLMLQARIQSSSPSSAIVLTYANLTPIATGNVVQITITYFI